jgi:16S rRNA (guanine(966)-N(2))-methyltransferase RsmD
LGFEALSREAKSVDMVEINLRSIAIIRKNMEKLKVSDGIQIHKGDAVEFVREYSGPPFDIVLIDPPFPLKICGTILKALSTSAAANSQSQIVIEHARQEQLPSPVSENMTCIDTRSYGDKIVAFFKKKE